MYFNRKMKVVGAFHRVLDRSSGMLKERCRCTVGHRRTTNKPYKHGFNRMDLRPLLITYWLTHIRTVNRVGFVVLSSYFDRTKGHILNEA